VKAVRDWRTYVRERLRLEGLPPERESRIVRELAAQLEDFYREALAAGRSEDEADAHARAQIRDWETMARDVTLAERANAVPPSERLAGRLEVIAGRRRSLYLLVDALRDMRYAARQLKKSPGFAIVAVLTLALGVGATTTVFSVANGVLLRPLPYPDAGTLVRVNEIVPQYGRFAVAPGTFLDWRAQAAWFEHIAAFNTGTATFAGSEGPERIPNASVSADFFELMRVAPSLGRTFTAEEDSPGKSAVVVLSHGMWQRRFGGDRNVVGRGVTLSGNPATIVGVMPEGFYFPRDAEYWAPLALNPANASRGGHFLGVIARLKPGVSASQAGAEMKRLAERLSKQYPETANESAEVVPLLEAVVGNVRGALLMLAAAVGVVLLIACANVANLLLVRASTREKEIAIRLALGASRGRLARQMLAESVLLALLGGSIGVTLAFGALEPVRSLSAGTLPRVQDVGVDKTVLLFALAVSVAVGLLFGTAPAWRASRPDVAAAVKEGGRTSAAGARWTHDALLVGEVALSLVLVAGAALLIRSFARLTDVNPGFRADNVLACRIALPDGYRQPQRRIAFFDGLLSRLESLPQVRRAGMVQTLPMRGGYFLSFSVQGRLPAKPGEEPSARHRVISPGYFEALSIPLLRGRTFTERDTAQAPMVAVVDEAFVARHFPGEEPLGRGIDIGNGSEGYYEIVGVVGNVRQEGLAESAGPTMYVPYAQDVFGAMWLVARTDASPAALGASVRQAVRELDPGVPVFGMTPLADVVAQSVGQRRFSMLLLGAFAAVALALAAVGIYGVVAYTVTQRTQEIGVRIAIGAARRDVMTLVLGGGMKLALAGVAIGLTGALLLSRLIESMLFGVSRLDPVSYGVTAALLLGIAVLACYVPARRATNVDPLVAIRQE
jgi:putative ABC transport system permease protein